MAFLQLEQKRSTIDRIGGALSGLGAGLTGNLTQFQALQAQREQQLSEERRRAAAEDIRRANMLLRQGDIEGIRALAPRS